MKTKWMTVPAIAIAMVVAAAAAPHGALHLQLERSQPEKDATVATSPTELHLWYSQEPQVKLTTVRLTGPGGATLDLKPIAIVEGDGKHLSAPVSSTLAAGAWTVAWRTLAKDGHVVTGEFAFTVGADR